MPIWSPSSLNVFNLQRLMRGEELTVKSRRLFGAIFERGGSKVYENFDITFGEQVYFRKLNEIAPSSKP